MSLTSIILFFVYIWGFGFSLTRFVKESKDFLERNIMRIALGIAVFTVLATLFTILKIPLNWWLFLILSLILPLIYLSKRIKKKELALPKLRIKKSTLYLLVVLVLFA